MSDSRLELVEFRIPQCTVRQVWFLFFDTTGIPYLKESNSEAVEITLFDGQRLHIFWHFWNPIYKGFSFVVKGRGPPDKLSTLHFGVVRKKWMENTLIHSSTASHPEVTVSDIRFAWWWNLSVCRNRTWFKNNLDVRGTNNTGNSWRPWNGIRTLVISSKDWRHYGIYIVETEKAECREAITFNIKHDKGN